MNKSFSFRPGNWFACGLLAALVVGMAAFVSGKPKEGNSIYFVVKPQLSKELLDQIAARLKSENVTVTYPQLRFDAGRLRSITVQINVAVPGTPKRVYTLSEDAAAEKFNALVFYCVADGKRVGLVRQTSNELTTQEKRLVRENLTGLLIERGRGREVIGHWQDD